MINVALLLNHPKLRDAVVSNLDPQHVAFQEEKEWKENSDIIFGKKNDILIIDFNAIRYQNFDVFLTIDTMCQNEDIRFVLLVKKASSVLQNLQQRLNRLSDIVETQSGRKDFDLKIRRIISEVAKEKKKKDKLEVTTKELQTEVHLELKPQGNIADSSVFELLFSILIRKATGNLTLKNGPLEQLFSFRNGYFVLRDGAHHSEDLRLAIAWKIGTYHFEKLNKMTGQAKDLEEILATGVREILPSRIAMQALMSEMELYPIPTSYFEMDRKLKLYYPEVAELKTFRKNDLKWRDIIATHGEHYFNVAYYALKTRLFQSAPSSHFQIEIIWSQELRKARDRVERAKIEQTKAFKTAQNPETVERELRNTLQDMKYQSSYEIFGLWEGCGRKNVRAVFYQLVKERHPDVYGNISETVKSYAQKIFISIKDAYSELLSLEKSNAPTQVGKAESSILSEIIEEIENVPSGEATILGPNLQRDSAVVHNNRAPSDSPLPDPSFPSFEKQRSTTDVRLKMERLSAVRKKRSRRRSFANKKITQPKITPPPTSEVERILAESETLEKEHTRKKTPKPLDRRKNKFEKLKERARKKNPNAISEGQLAFSEGFQLFRDQRIEKAFEKFAKAFALEDRASHKAFYAYSLFKTAPDEAEEAERLIREAIEMNDKQTQPDALFFLAQMLKARGDKKNAYKAFESAFKLNPMNREAEREVRLFKLRRSEHKNTDPGKFIKNLFKK